MRRSITKLLLLVMAVCYAPPAGAEEDGVAASLRRRLQAVWYAGDPVAFLEALGKDDLDPLFEEHEQTCRLSMYLADSVSRGDFAAEHADTWKQIVARLESLIGKAPVGVEEAMEAVTDGDPMQTWARVEIQLLGVMVREKLGTSTEDDWKLLGAGSEVISRTERPGIWTTYGYGRAFSLAVRSMGLKVTNRWSCLTSFVYLKTKMGQRPGLFARHAMAVAGVYQVFGEGWMSATSKKPKFEEARPKLEDALRTIADYAARDRVPMSALLLHNDIVDLIDDVPDLEMEATRKTATLDRIHEALVPRSEAIEANLVLPLPLSRRWRVLEGLLGEVPALHVLRTRKGEAAYYEITIAALTPADKHMLPGQKRALKGSGHRALAVALLKAAKGKLGARAKGKGPKKEAFHALPPGYRYEASAGDLATWGYVGKGPTHTVVIEITRHGPSTEEMPRDVEQLLEGLAFRQ